MWLRNRRAGLALVVIALGCRLEAQLAARPDNTLGLIFATVGLWLFILSVQSRLVESGSISKILTILVGGSGLGLAYIYSGWMRLPLLALSGVSLILLEARLRPRSWLYRLWLGLALLVICGSSSLLLYRLGWWFHDISLPHQATLINRVFPNLAITDGLLAVWTPVGAKSVRITFEGLGFYEVWFIGSCLLGFAALMRLRTTARWVGLCLAVTIGYSLLRFAVIVATAIEFDMPRLLWDSRVMVASWLPVGFILPPPRLGDGQWRFEVSQRTSKRCLLAIPVALVVAIAIGFKDPGHLKQGRVVIDETHANWEWTHLVFDTTSVGIRSEYNYRSFYEYIARSYRVSRCTTGISRSMLDTTDILIIKTPTEPYSPEEIEAIVAFVRCGGGLLLIGDHTNLFGMSTYLNAIAENFGMRFRYDDTFDLATTGLTVFSPDALSHHPSVRKVEDFTFLTSCTIEASPLVEPVMVGRGLGSEDVDYSHPNFFGNIAYDLCDRFGLFLQAGARRFGEGRVLLFTDSTCFSNFCMFSRGKPELVSGLLDYLNRRGGGYGLVHYLIGFAALGLLALLGLIPSPTRQSPHLLVAVYLILLIGLHLGNRLSLSLYGDIATYSPDRTVLFDVSHSRASFSDYFGLSRQGDRADYTELYISTQRIGLEPVAARLDRLEQIQPVAVVLIEPQSPFSQNEIADLMAYVKQGGRLLVIDSVCNGSSTANQLIEQFGMRLYLAYETRSDSTGQSILPTLAIAGGVEVHAAETGCQVRCSQVGDGYVVVAVDGFRFTGTVLGRLLKGRVPDVIMRRYREASRLLRLSLVDIAAKVDFQR